MRGLLFGAAVGVLGLAISAHAQAPAEPADLGPMPTYGAWHSSRIGGGGYVMNVIPTSDPKVYYTHIDVGGLYRSEDGGNTWKMLHGALPPRRGSYSVRGLCVDPRDPANLIIATGCQWDVTDGIYVSRDAGKSWKPVTSKLYFDGNGPTRGNGLILARHPANPDIVLAASIGSGVWKTSDNGETWEKLGMEGLHPTDIRFDRANPDRLWLCTRKVKSRSVEGENGLYRSTDGGKTWEKINEDGFNEVAQDAQDAQRLYGLRGNLAYTSADGGATWELFSDGLRTDPAKANSTNGLGYSALATGPGFAMVGSTDGTVYRLNSGEKTWQKVAREGLEASGTIRGKHGWGWAMASITIDPRDPDHWFNTDFFSLSQTKDAGKNWQVTINGLEDTVIHAVVQDPSDPGLVHLGMADNGYFTSVDGGASFKRYAFPNDAISCKDIALSAKLPSRLYAVGSKMWDQQIGQVYVSIDRGAKWEKSPMLGLPDLNKAMCTSIAVDAADPYTVYLTVSGDVKPGAGGPYKSTDGGKSWTWIGQGLPEGKPLFWYSPWAQGRELAAGADGTIIAISRIDSNRGIFRYDAKSQSWSRCEVKDMPGTPNSTAADLLSPGRFFVANRDGCLYRSTDDGVTWSSVYDKPATHVVVDKAVPNRAAASTIDGVILSTDGGSTWREMDKSLPDRVSGNMPAFVGERLVVGSDGSGAFWIPVSAAGEQAVTAKPAIRADIPAELRKAIAAPKLTNLKMEEGAEKPAGWNVWTSSGKFELTRDTKTVRTGKASLSLKSVDGPAKGTAFQDFQAVATPFEIKGWAKVDGVKPDKVQMAIQVFDAKNAQIAWIIVDTLTSAKTGKWFTNTVALPDGAAQCKLILLFEGDGQVWLDDLTITPKPLVAFP